MIGVLAGSATRQSKGKAEAHGEGSAKQSGATGKQLGSSDMVKDGVLMNNVCRLETRVVLK